MKRKKRRTCGHGVKSIPNFIAKGDGLANSRDVNPLETIWTIADKTTYKDPAPKILDELRE